MPIYISACLYNSNIKHNLLNFISLIPKVKVNINDFNKYMIIYRK